MVGIDLFEAEGPLNREMEITMMNAVCWGSNFQWVARMKPPHTPEHVLEVFSECWLRVFGTPEVVICDQSIEFRASFQDRLRERGCVVHVIDVWSPWRNGKTERHGGWWKELVRKAVELERPQSEGETNLTIATVTGQKNRYSNRSGFSPHQRVFGSNARLPGVLLSDDLISPEMLSADPSAEFQRAEAIRTVVARATALHSDRAALRRALHAQMRKPPEPLRIGERVFVYRRAVPEAHGWTGPGSVVMVSESSNTVWVYMRSTLVKGSREQCEQVRCATNEESLGIGLVSELLSDLREELRTNRRQRGFRDVSGEGPPPNYEPDVADEIRLAGIPEEPDLEGGGLVRAETDVNPPRSRSRRVRIV